MTDQETADGVNPAPPAEGDAQEVQADDQGRVPYGRFKEVNDAKKEAEAKIARLEAALPNKEQVKKDDAKEGEGKDRLGRLEKMVEQLVTKDTDDDTRKAINRLGKKASKEQVDAINNLKDKHELSTADALALAPSRHPDLFGAVTLPGGFDPAQHGSVAPRGGRLNYQQNEDVEDPMQQLVDKPQMKGVQRKKVIMAALAHRKIKANFYQDIARGQFAQMPED